MGEEVEWWARQTTHTRPRPHPVSTPHLHERRQAAPPLDQDAHHDGGVQRTDVFLVHRLITTGSGDGAGFDTAPQRNNGTPPPPPPPHAPVCPNQRHHHTTGRRTRWRRFPCLSTTQRAVTRGACTTGSNRQTQGRQHAQPAAPAAIGRQPSCGPPKCRRGKPPLTDRGTERRRR